MTERERERERERDNVQKIDIGFELDMGFYTPHNEGCAQVWNWLHVFKNLDEAKYLVPWSQVLTFPIAMPN